MKYFWIVLSLFLCSACSVSVSPIATPTGTINQKDNSITETREGIAFTAKLDELSMVPQGSKLITSFYFRIDNRTERQVSFPPSSFLLKDGNGQQYLSLTPERVREIVSADTVYLIPYPYVGYYYLEDQFVAANNEPFSSSLPFYAEYHPQEILTRALTREPILKNSGAAGVVYFAADLQNTNYVEILIYPGAETSGEPIVRLPFAIGK